tara:strand:- start:411 stop:644 length:234 start_codon:yes stop_codon:yes gene_type:complete
MKTMNDKPSKAQWKYYRDDVVGTLRTISNYVENGKYDYDQQDLDRLLDQVKYNYAHYIELRDGKEQKEINRANPIQF